MCCLSAGELNRHLTPAVVIPDYERMGNDGGIVLRTPYDSVLPTDWL